MRVPRTTRVGKAPLSADLRWRVIWLTQLRNYSAKKIARVLSISRSTVCRIRSCFRRTGEVLEHGQVARRPRVMTPELDRALVDLVIDTPESTAKEHYESFCAAHNLDVHYSTICRALARLGYTCKTLRGYCRSRDEQAALAFKAHIVSTFSPKQLFFLDETAKDPRALNRRFGWAMRGGTPIHSCGMIGRGQRHSALCGFDVKGFVNWYITTGTFNKERFLDAFKATVVRAVCRLLITLGAGLVFPPLLTLAHACLALQLPHVKPFPGKRSVIIMDNASIHHCPELLPLVNAAGAILLYTPPYCFDCTPLDNGAFGWVKRYLQKHAGTFEHVDLDLVLDKAFRRVRPRHARCFFRNCGYL